MDTKRSDTNIPADGQVGAPASLATLDVRMHKKSRKWIWYGFAALAALQLYYVREMVAALLIFSVLFFMVSVLALVVYLLDWASESAIDWAQPHATKVTGKALDWAEPHAAKAARTVAGHSGRFLDEARKKLLRHLRSETAR